MSEVIQIRGKRKTLQKEEKAGKTRKNYRDIDIRRDAILQLAQDSLASNEWGSVFRNHRILQEFSPYDTKTLALDDLIIRDQGNSGRCWIFTAMNDLKVFSDHFKPSLSYETQLSVPYLLFFHLLEYCGAFLEFMIGLLDKEPNDREFQYLFKMGITDGGNTAMAIHILEKYGCVPEYAMPETYQSQNTADLLVFLNRLLRASVVKMKKHGDKDKDSIEKIRDETLVDCRRMLEACLGTPPSMIRIHPKFYEKPTIKHPKMMSPVEFYKSFTRKRMEVVPCISGPSSEKFKPGTWFYTDKSETMLGLEPREKAYLVMDIHDMETLCRKSILEKYPVFIGADVGYDFENKVGLADVGLFDASPLYHTERVHDIPDAKEEEFGDIHSCPKLTDSIFRVSKEEKVHFGMDGPNHAMLLVGFITDNQKPSGEITYWVLLNSWGYESGKEGYMYISACWFRENVYFTNFQKSLFHKTDLKERYPLEPKNEDVIILPAWEPVGQLLRPL
jgi:bleomycin hydrolase